MWLGADLDLALQEFGADLSFQFADAGVHQLFRGLNQIATGLIDQKVFFLDPEREGGLFGCHGVLRLFRQETPCAPVCQEKSPGAGSGLSVAAEEPGSGDGDRSGHAGVERAFEREGAGGGQRNLPGLPPVQASGVEAAVIGGQRVRGAVIIGDGDRVADGGR